MAKAACSVEFPLYGVTVLEQDKIVLVGGGGSMKSGIPNMVVSAAQGPGRSLQWRGHGPLIGLYGVTVLGRYVDSQYIPLLKKWVYTAQERPRF